MAGGQSGGSRHAEGGRPRAPTYRATPAALPPRPPASPAQGGAGTRGTRSLHSAVLLVGPSGGHWSLLATAPSPAIPLLRAVVAGGSLLGWCWSSCDAGGGALGLQIGQRGELQSPPPPPSSLPPQLLLLAAKHSGYASLVLIGDGCAGVRLRQEAWCRWRGDLRVRPDLAVPASLSVDRFAQPSNSEDLLEQYGVQGNQ